MSPRFARAFQIALLGALALSPVGAGHALAKEKKPKERHYVVVDLGVVNGGDYSIGYAINSKGVVAGMARAGQLTHAVSLKDTTLRILGDGLATSSANGINDDGEIVGFIADPNGGQHAAFWDKDGQLDLGTLGGSTSIAHGINDDGVVVGESALSGDEQTHAVIWSNNGAQDLGATGGDWSAALAVNDDGDVVGFSTTAPGQNPYGDGTRAVVWRDGQAIDIGTLGGDIGVATAINDDGVVVGGATTGPGVEYGAPGTHAFLWKEGQLSDLGAPDGANVSSANDIADNGVVVGFAGNQYTDDPNSTLVATLWEKDGTLVNLNVTVPRENGWYLVSALAINDKGQITGLGIINGQYHGFLLVPSK